MNISVKEIASLELLLAEYLDLSNGCWFISFHIIPRNIDST